MHRFLATVSLLALAACGVEPQVQGANADALMWEVNPDLNLGGLLVLERCQNGVDDDGDGLVDSKDPDCGGGGLFGGGGFLGGSTEGTGISDPWDGQDGPMEMADGTRGSYKYAPGDERGEIPTVLTITQGERGDIVTEVVLFGDAIVSFQSAMGVGDREASLILETRSGAAWLAAGPIGDTQFVTEDMLGAKR